MPLVWNSRRLRRCMTMSSSASKSMPVRAGQLQAPAVADLLHHRVGSDRVDEVGLLAGEAEDDRLHAAVPVPGRAERAEELDVDARDVRRAGRRARSPSTKRYAAFIGPTVCELDGPIPTLNRSNTLMVIADPSAAVAVAAGTPMMGLREPRGNRRCRRRGGLHLAQRARRTRTLRA